MKQNMINENLEESVVFLLQQKYKKSLKQIKNEFEFNTFVFSKDCMKKCMLKQKNIIIKLVKDVFLFYPELSKVQFIALNGSFARGSNILSSDLDLNLFYENKYRDILFPIELRIQYVLSKLLEFKGCDRIHSIMVYTSAIYSDLPIFDGSFLFFHSNKISYFLRENSEQLLNETFQTSRDFKKLEHYFESRFNKNHFYDEWTNNFLLLQDNGSFLEFKSGIWARDEKIYQNFDYDKIMLQEINNLLDDINQYSFLKENDLIEIKYLKLIYKEQPMKILYKALTILSRSHCFHNNSIPFLVSKHVIGEEFEKNIYFYLWCIMRLQFILESFSLDFSSHSSKVISRSELEKRYEFYYHDRLGEITEKSIQNLFEEIVFNLKRERRKLI